MNTFENVIKESLEDIQVKPSEALHDRIMKSVVSGRDFQRFYRRKSYVRVAILAAVIAAFLLTTAATYGSEIVAAIKQVIFGDSIGTQIVPEHELYLGSWGIMNRSNLDGAVDYPLGVFDTLEEAREAAPFYIREPAYLPDSVSGLRSIGVWRVEDPDNPWMHFVSLNYEIPFKFEVDGVVVSGTRLLSLEQTYGGPDAYISVNTIFDIEKTMVGSNEAVLIHNEGRSLTVDAEVIIVPQNKSYTLCWMNDGIAFVLENDYPDGVDLDTMIKIAESVR